MLANPLPLFDDDIYFQSRTSLKTDLHNFATSTDADNDIPYVYSSVLARVTKRKETFNEPAENRNDVSATSLSLLNSSFDASRWTNEEESDIHLLRMRMSFLKAPTPNKAPERKATSSPKKTSNNNQPPSASELQDDLRYILSALQLQNVDQIRNEIASISQEIHNIISAGVAQDKQHIKLARLFNYFTSLQNAAGLADIIEGRDESSDARNTSQFHASSVILPSDELFSNREANGFSHDGFDLAGDNAPILAIEDVTTGTSSKKRHQQYLNELLQELALLPGITVQEVDAKLVEAEDALLETVQRIQTEVAKGEHPANFDPVSSQATNQNGIHWHDKEELQDRRLYLHKLLEIYELMTTPEETLNRKQPSKVLVPKKLRSKHPTSSPMAHLKKSTRAKSPISTTKQQKKDHNNHLSTDHSAYQQNSLQDEETQRPSPTKSYHPVSTIVTPSAHSRFVSPSSAPMRADSLSPSMSSFAHHNTHNNHHPSSTSPAIVLSSSHQPNHHNGKAAQRSTSPLLFTSPAPAKVYQSPFLQQNMHASNQPSATAALTHFSPTSSYDKYDDRNNDINSSKNNDFERRQPEFQAPAPQRGISNNNKRAVSPSALFSPAQRVNYHFSGRSNTNNSNNNQLNESSILTDAQDATLTTSMLTSPTPSSFSSSFLRPSPAAASSVVKPTTNTANDHNSAVGKGREDHHVSYAMNSPITNKPNYNNGSSIATNKVASPNQSYLSSHATMSASSANAKQQLLRSARSFTEKDAQQLNELLYALNLNKFTTRVELDQELSVRQRDLQDALKHGRTEDVKRIKLQMENLRAAYRLVAIRG